MKKVFIIFSLALLVKGNTFAQTNTFPVTGNVGIGTTNPVSKLQIGNFNDGGENKIVIPGIYNFERVNLGQESNGNGLLEFVNHNSMSNSYGVKIGSNIDKYGAGLYIVLAPSTDAYSSLNYSSTPAFFINTANNVGIGTANPLAKLDVGISSNDALSTVLARLPEGNHVESGTYLGVRAINTTTVAGPSFSLEHRFYGQLNSSINFHIGGGTEGGFITFSTGDGTEAMRLDEKGNLGIGKLKEGATSLSLAMSQESNGYVRMQSVKSQGVSYGDLIFNEFGGNVGIGTNDAKGYKLAVAGNVIAEEVKVKLRANWPDYVFTKEYKLPTLQETEQHIKEKGHLPGIPSAEEVRNNGVDLGDMNAKLLQKIEELTLHLIEQQKQIEKLNQENVKIKELEMKINQLTIVK